MLFQVSTNEMQGQLRNLFPAAFKKLSYNCFEWLILVFTTLSCKKDQICFFCCYKLQLFFLFSAHPVSSIRFFSEETYRHRVEVDGQNILLEILDTAGQVSANYWFHPLFMFLFIYFIFLSISFFYLIFIKGIQRRHKIFGERTILRMLRAVT